MTVPLRANIHHFFAHPITGHVEYDEDGDPQLGYYYELTKLTGEPLCGLMGPYGTAEECEEQCQRAWQTGDF